ncbi:thiamine monophosphate kinase [Amycolatopsis mediterranei S699]|uniref:Thiamine-monophosphate kinase n=2 Tax=Amycolatopsis mediterranei TaxID=33910 RepID=A0A0H3DBY8_AMYMU|nr:thiamine-phosphate kinase [Amycolatopsis mediterranei]ADJ48475.1 thiamine monophosphate kinase [Amycolatopsis mediterranei U32]AEK45398.1 thiamine monophosphate kinase [Amycolatopsis mediterranei S699]AFO80186.1 thiamine monophosphate kinase [Amycolatopsis mediterranei S699]AGT87314.1 thiamine monophosphate kinase [Amycolatopsis mediterranei RB]KDO10992.1 thiamine monophosphate kinase [Amycolatopsis mediterranei]
MSGTTELTLGDLGERGIQEKVFQPRYGAVEGFGDDSALLGAVSARSELVATTDSCPTPLVNLLREPDLYHAGWLLATINLSDLAAAGAEPLGLVVNYTLPKATTVGEFERLLDGVDDCCVAHGTKVAGGDIRDGEVVQLTATAIGRCGPGRRLRRSGAQRGDRLILVGSPGYLWAAALLETGQATLPQPDRAEVWRRACRPTAQLKAGRVLAATGLARATMDVSDGLFATVRTLCEANGLGAAVTGEFELDEWPASVAEQCGLPPFALAQTWGDWGLVVAAGAGDVQRVTEALRGEGVAAQEIGTLTADGRLTSGPENTPWQGIAQERFSASSWHGGELSTLVTEVLGRR